MWTDKNDKKEVIVKRSEHIYPEYLMIYSLQEKGQDSAPGGDVDLERSLSE